MNRLNAATPVLDLNIQEFSANNISTNLFCASIQIRLSALVCLFPAFISAQVSFCSLVAVVLVFVFASVFRNASVLALHSLQRSIVRHIFEITDDSRMRTMTKTVERPSLLDMEDDFALRYARIYPGANSRAELVTLVPGLRSQRLFAPLARGLISNHAKKSSLN